MNHPSGHQTRIDLVVDGMSCGHCAQRVRVALEGLAGVSAVQVDLAAGRARADIDPGRLTAADLAATVTAAGYPARLEG